jgi:flagellar biogenesis protein FliO
MRKIRLLLISLVLGVGTAYAISALRHLPYSRGRDLVTDTLSLPGGILASIFYPEGVHTGGGAATWPIVALAGNLLCYTVFWLFLLWVVVKVRHPKAE